MVHKVQGIYYLVLLGDKMATGRTGGGGGGSWCNRWVKSDIAQSQVAITRGGSQNILEREQADTEHG